MCGIFAYAGTQQDTPSRILAGLKILEYRGYDSWGIAVTRGNTLVTEKHIGKIGDAHTTLPDSPCGIGHTRWATHGGVIDKNAHPHTNTDQTIAIVHNGIVENYRELRQQLAEAGYIFRSETDSEIIAHLIDRTLKHSYDFVTSVMHTFKQLHGSNGIVALYAPTHEIVGCRDGSPLVVGHNSIETVIASDPTAIATYTQDMYFLADGETVHIKQNTVTIYNMYTDAHKPCLFTKQDIQNISASKGSFPHAMLKEIYDQAQIIRMDIALPNEPLTHKRSFIWLIGCGSAFFAALYGQYVFAQAGIHTQAIPANEFDVYIDLIQPHDYVITVSQSGETADVISAIKKAKQKNAYVIGIVNSPHSTLERLADNVVPVQAGTELAVVSTKAFTRQIQILSSLAHGKSLIEKNNISDWIKYIDAICNDIAKSIKSNDVYIIGKQRDYPLALEIAMKIKESSYVHAEGFAAGELKHGVIALIQQGTPCIAVATDETLFNETMSSCVQLKSRGAYVIGIGIKAHESFDTFIDIGGFDYHIRTINAIIVGQLLGYHLAVLKGCDPDKPRNLAKSVTVK